jgi:hypothetical protein
MAMDNYLAIGGGGPSQLFGGRLGGVSKVVVAYNLPLTRCSTEPKAVTNTNVFLLGAPDILVANFTEV